MYIEGKREKHIEYETVRLEVLDRLTIPVWLKYNKICDYCLYDFEKEDTHVTAVRYNGGVKFYHLSCADEAIKLD